jgi:hypothetical protein
MNTGRRVALVIGISYKDRTDIPRLNGTINDASNMSNLLESLGYRVTFMNDNNISSSPLYPTRQNIQNAIIQILQTSRPGDDIVIYYSGHGLLLLNQIHNHLLTLANDQTVRPVDRQSDMRINNQFNGNMMNGRLTKPMNLGVGAFKNKQFDENGRIIMDENIINYVEENDGMEDAIAPVNVILESTGVLEETVIRDDELNLWLRQFGRLDTRIFLIFDCCHSGNMCDLKYMYNFPSDVNRLGIPCRNITVNEIKDTIITGDNERIVSDFAAVVITLSACKDSEVSWEDYVTWDRASREKEGILTSSLIYNIRTDPAASRDIFKLLYCIAMQSSSYGQHPKLSASIPLHEGVNDPNRFIFGNVPLQQDLLMMNRSLNSQQNQIRSRSLQRSLRTSQEPNISLQDAMASVPDPSKVLNFPTNLSEQHSINRQQQGPIRLLNNRGSSRNDRNVCTAGARQSTGNKCNRNIPNNAVSYQMFGQGMGSIVSNRKNNRNDMVPRLRPPAEDGFASIHQKHLTHFLI